MNRFEITGYSRNGLPYQLDVNGDRIYLLECEFCKKDFVNKSPSMKFCSSECVSERGRIRRKKLKEQSERLVKTSRVKKQKDYIDKTKEKNNGTIKDVRENVEVDIEPDSSDDHYIKDDIFLLLNLKVLKYKDSSDIKETIAISNNEEDINAVSIVGSFFREFDRIPNNHDMVLLPNYKNRKKISELYKDINYILDIFENKYSNHEHSVKSCETCGRLFSEYHSGHNGYCSEDCVHVEDKVNVCITCNNKFYGVDGYENICGSCSGLSEEERKLLQENKINKRKNNDEDIIRELVKIKVNSIIENSKKPGNSWNGVSINYNYTGGFTESIKNKVRKRDEYTCQVCGKTTNLHVHHIVSRKNGGSHNLENLILLCASCHMSIETGIASHAINKCTKNALIYGGYYSSIKNNLTDEEKSELLFETLLVVFDRVKEDFSKEEILTYIDGKLDVFL